MERLYVISLPQWRHVSGMASRITDCLVNNLFRQTTKYTSKRHIIMIILALYEGNPPVTVSVSMSWRHRADSRLAPSQLETSLESNAVSHWLGVNLEWALTSSCMIVEFYAWKYYATSGVIKGVGLAHERRRYIVTPSLIGWAHIQNDLCIVSFTALGW